MPGIELGLTGKTVIVLGGGQGIGESTSLLLADAGANVAVVDIDPDRAERVAGLVQDRGSRSAALAVDVTDEPALVSAIARVGKELGDLYGLMTIVGSAFWVPIIDMTTEQWDIDQQRNVRYFFVAAREVARALMRNRAAGSIVCVTSIDGMHATAYHAGYGASKAALISLVKSMSAEWGLQGIRVNAVAPGSTITPSTPDLGARDTRPATIPMRRRGSTDEIAKAALFLLSDQASYVTGQTVAVDGGVTAIGPFAYGLSPTDHIFGDT